MLVDAPLNLGLYRYLKDISYVFLSGVAVAVSLMHHFPSSTDTTPA